MLLFVVIAIIISVLFAGIFFLFLNQPVSQQRTLPRLNQVCNGDDLPCDNGFICGSNFVCLSDLGSPCIQNIDCIKGICAGGKICLNIPDDGNSGNAPDELSGCNFPLVLNSEGTICVIGENQTNTKCQKGSDCFTGFCRSDGICVQGVKGGQPCSNRDICEPPYICDGLCQPRGIPAGSIGRFCDNANPCLSGKCNTNVCVNNGSSKIGDFCTQNSDCIAGTTCINAVFGKICSGDNTNCSKGETLVSGQCVSNSNQPARNCIPDGIYYVFKYNPDGSWDNIANFGAVKNPTHITAAGSADNPVFGVFSENTLYVSDNTSVNNAVDGVIYNSGVLINKATIDSNAKITVNNKSFSPTDSFGNTPKGISGISASQIGDFSVYNDQGQVGTVDNNNISIDSNKFGAISYMNKLSRDLTVIFNQTDNTFTYIQKPVNMDVNIEKPDVDTRVFANSDTILYISNNILKSLDIRTTQILSYTGFFTQAIPLIYKNNIYVLSKGICSN